MPAKSKNNNSDKNPIKLLLIMFCLLLVGVLGMGGYILYKTNLASSDKLVFKNLSPETTKKLEGTLVYSTENLDSVDYYSPSLDLTLNYSKNKYFLAETPSSLMITEENGYSPNALSLIMKRVDYPVDDLVLDKVTEDYSFNTNFEIINETVDGDYNVAVAKYTTPALLEGGIDKTIYVTFFYKKFDTDLIYISAKNVNPENAKDLYLADVKAIATSINTDTSNIDTNIKIALARSIVTLGFDKTKWEMLHQSEESVAIYFRSYNLETDKAFQFGQPRFAVRVNPVYVDQDTTKEGILAELLKDASYLESADYVDNFRYLEKAGTRNIDGIDFYYITYAIDKSFGDENYTEINEVYRGIYAPEEVYVDIEIEYPSTESNAYSAGREVLDNIKFSKALSMIPVDNVLGTSSVEIKKAGIIGTPAVSKVFSRACFNATFKNLEGLGVNNKTYTMCNAGTGSGFWVNKDGYMVTNSHVVDFNEFDTFIFTNYDPVSGGWNPEGWVPDLAKDVLLAFVAQGVPISAISDEALLQATVEVAYDFYNEGYIDIVETESEVYIQKNAPFNVEMSKYMLNNAASHYKANVQYNIEMDSSIIASIEDSYVPEADVALLKTVAAPDTDLAVVSLANPDLVSVGQPIYVIGYPGVADSKYLFSEQASLIPTVTAGTISAVKPSSNNKYELVQIDASIDHGNSGGPILSNEGSVIGVATYGINPSQSGNYNAGVSVEEVSKVLSNNSVTNDIGTTTPLLKKALDAMSNEYYKRALENFNEILEKNPDTKSVVDPLIAVAEEKIENGEDKTPIVSIGDFDIPNTVLFIGGGAVVLVLVIIVLVVLLLKKKGKQPKQSPPQAPTAPVALVAPQKPLESIPDKNAKEMPKVVPTVTPEGTPSAVVIPPATRNQL